MGTAISINGTVQLVMRLNTTIVTGGDLLIVILAT